VEYFNAYMFPTDVPEPPQNLKVVGVTKSQIKIAYDPPENDGGAAVTGYMVERKEKNSPRWIKATKMPISDTEFSSLGMPFGLKHCLIQRHYRLL